MKQRRRDTRNARTIALLLRKICPFCADKQEITYKDIGVLKGYITEGGKIVPRRISGVCASHQRELTHSIKRARNIALLSFTKGTIHQTSRES